MTTRRKWMVGLVCVVSMAMLTPAALALDFPMTGDPSGTQYEVNTPLPNDFFHFIYAAGVDFVGGSLLPAGNWIVTGDDCVVNFYDCVFEAGSLVYIASDSLDGGESYTGNVTFYGTEFAIDGVGLKSGDPLPTNVTYDNGKLFCTENVLSGKNANDQYFEVTLTCQYYGSTANPTPPMMYCNLEWLDQPSVIDVVVDIKPDSSENTINLGSMGVIPVGILSTADFDATQVDPWEVNLAGADVAIRGKGSKLLSSIKDLNGDGLLDLEVKVETENLDPGLFQDGAAVLTGKTYDGVDIQGSDSITIVPE